MVNEPSVFEPLKFYCIGRLGSLVILHDLVSLAREIGKPWAELSAAV